MQIGTILKEGFSGLKNILSDLFFPPLCPFCDSPDLSSGAGLCRVCAESIHTIEEPFCKHCGLPLPKNNIDDLICGQCLSAPPAYHKARYGLRYKGALRDGLTRFKYGGALYTTSALSEFLIRAFHKYYKPDEFDLILPVPVHRKKLKERGFNQVVILAENLSRNTGIPVDRISLKKFANTPPQASLSRNERLKNLRGSFRITRPDAIENKRVLLVDDVATTGSTINEAAKTIKGSGTARVDALVLALTFARDNDLHYKTSSGPR